MFCCEITVVMDGTSGTPDRLRAYMRPCSVWWASWGWVMMIHSPTATDTLASVRERILVGTRRNRSEQIGTVRNRPEHAGKDPDWTFPPDVH
ncbi:hypothetical protein GCM10010977_25980 [Citricoccus zhacaiensis]|uniref:Uncharacterized protein n=1 Tax=Citricoccus zhacaiensis TaxID=489142 RepID=A0ABQ2M703_9MICC|nr:hypothetical protein GCM10010977_25980 [Citricoccus zhacaiensis]